MCSAQSSHHREIRLSSSRIKKRQSFAINHRGKQHTRGTRAEMRIIFYCLPESLGWESVSLCCLIHTARHARTPVRGRKIEFNSARVFIWRARKSIRLSTRASSNGAQAISIFCAAKCWKLLAACQMSPAARHFFNSPQNYANDGERLAVAALFRPRFSRRARARRTKGQPQNKTASGNIKMALCVIYKSGRVPLSAANC